MLSHQAKHRQLARRRAQRRAEAAQSLAVSHPDGRDMAQHDAVHDLRPVDPLPAADAGRMKAGRALGLAAACAFGTSASAWESDVHYGLTRWLALRAGFDAAQAQAIALGDQRQDGGLMDTLTLTPEVACTGRGPAGWSWQRASPPGNCATTEPPLPSRMPAGH
jgi:hypothetical protein